MYKLLELVKKSAGNKVNTQEIIRKLNSKLETIYNSIKNQILRNNSNKRGARSLCRNYKHNLKTLKEI